MDKDFNKWNQLKISLEKNERELFAHPSEI